MTKAVKTPKCGECVKHPPCDRDMACCVCDEKGCNGRQSCANGKAAAPCTPEVLPPEVLKPTRGRPLKILSIVGDKPVAERAKAICNYHTLAREHAAQTAYYMVLCGLELMAVQAKLPHGQWETWVDANAPFNNVTAWKYMETAKRLSASPQIFTMVKICQSGKSLQSLPAPDREKAIAAIKKATDGKTITQLYLDLDIVKQPRDYTHIGGNADLRAWLGEHHPECKAVKVDDLPKGIRAEYEAHCAEVEAEKARAEQENPPPTAAEIHQCSSRLRWTELVDGLREFVMRRHGHAEVDPQQLKTGIESLKDCVKKLAEDFARMSA